MGHEKKKITSDDWSRFERAVDVALKTPAKHKVSSLKKPKKPAKSKVD